MKTSITFFAASLMGLAALLPVAQAEEKPAGVNLAAGLISVRHEERRARGVLIVRPAVAEEDSRVTLIGRGLRPHARLLVVAGRNPDRMRAVRTVRANAAGRVSASVSLPEWASAGRHVFFALQWPDGRTAAMARPVRVVDGGEDEGDDRITVTGTLLDPTATCPRLAGDDGRIYALAGSLRQFDTGDRVRVSGELSGVSICNQRRTIAVERIRDAD